VWLLTTEICQQEWKTPSRGSLNHPYYKNTEDFFTKTLRERVRDLGQGREKKKKNDRRIEEERG